MSYSAVREGQVVQVTVDELAMFMNTGWPGENWYIDDHDAYAWDNAFIEGCLNEIYQPRERGKLVNLGDFEATVRWQGIGRDPTAGRGHRLTTLFLRWQQRQRSATVVALVPKDRLEEVRHLLHATGCIVAN
jgi:hypothetical protein